MRPTRTANDEDLGALRFERVHDEPGVFWGHTRSTFRCHERGVVVTDGKVTHRLLFAELDALSFGTIDLFAPAGYRGTQYHLEFHPLGCRPGEAHVFDCITRPIKKEGLFWSWTDRTEPIRVTDPDLERLRDDLSMVIARRMLAALESAGSVEWTQGLRLTRDALEYPAGRDQLARLPFAEIGKIDAANGHFFVYPRGGSGWVVTAEAIGINFYPGLHLLRAAVRDGGA